MLAEITDDKVPETDVLVAEEDALVLGNVLDQVVAVAFNVASLHCFEVALQQPEPHLLQVDCLEDAGLQLVGAQHRPALVEVVFVVVLMQHVPKVAGRLLHLALVVERQLDVPAEAHFHLRLLFPLGDTL